MPAAASVARTAFLPPGTEANRVSKSGEDERVMVVGCLHRSLRRGREALAVSG